MKGRAECMVQWLKAVRANGEGGIVRKSNMDGPKGRKRGNGHNANNFAACVDADARTKKQRGSGRGELVLALGEKYTLQSTLQNSSKSAVLAYSCGHRFRGSNLR